VLLAAVVFGGFVAFLLDVLCEVLDPLFAHAGNGSCIRSLQTLARWMLLV